MNFSGMACRLPSAVLKDIGINRSCNQTDTNTNFNLLAQLASMKKIVHTPTCASKLHY
jgi:hypothetical protein